MRFNLRALLSSVVVLSFAGFVMAAPLGAPVLASGASVSVNQFHAANGAALRIGDQIATGSTGSAVVTMGASRANFGAASAATLESGALRMGHGYLRVTGMLPLEIGRVTVTPAANTDYEMLTLASGTSYVRVYRGSVAVSGVTKPITVTSGNSAVINGATAQTAAAATCTGLAGLSATEVAAIVAASVGVAVIVTYEATKTTSPTQP